MHDLTKSADILENPLIRSLLTLDLKCDDFVIFGSGPLLAHGIRRRISDLDVVARGAAWDTVCESPHGAPAVGEITGDPMVHFETEDGSIRVSEKWIYDDWDTDKLIDEAEIIGGLRFAQLTEVLRYKQREGRPKDLEDIKAMNELEHAPMEVRARPAVRDLISRLMASRRTSSGELRVLAARTSIA